MSSVLYSSSIHLQSHTLHRPLASNNNSTPMTHNSMLPYLRIAWLHMHVSALESCLESLQAWFCANSMTLNPDKSNAILFVTTQRAQSLPNQVSVNISGVTIPCVIPLTSMIRTIAAALVTSRLDYANSVLYRYTASPQNISLASSVFKILSRVLLEVVVLLIVLLI